MADVMAALVVFPFVADRITLPSDRRCAEAGDRAGIDGGQQLARDRCPAALPRQTGQTPGSAREPSFPPLAAWNRV